MLAVSKIGTLDKLNLYVQFCQTLLLCFLAVTHLEDVGALVDDNLFERDILIATKKLASSSNISERTQGNNKPVPPKPVVFFSFLSFLCFSSSFVKPEQK